MDSIDIKLMHLLAEDADVTTSSLVSKLNLSIPAINKRIAKLKSEGYISRTTILTDTKKVGKPIVCFVLVALEHFTLSEKLLEIVQSDQDILECYATTGEYDYILKVCAKDIEDYEDKLLRLKEEGIAKSLTMFALREYKFSHTALPDPSEI